MYEKLNVVEIGGRKLPIKCNISVMAALQDEFGTLREFEMKILGMIPILDEDGNQKMIKNDSGYETPAFRSGEPNIRTLMFALPKFIREGIECAEEMGEDELIAEFDYKDAIKEADFSILDVALALHGEYRRCYDRKKLVTPQKKNRSRGPAKKKN